MLLTKMRLLLSSPGRHPESQMEPLWATLSTMVTWDKPQRSCKCQARRLRSRFMAHTLILSFRSPLFTEHTMALVSVPSCNLHGRACFCSQFVSFLQDFQIGRAEGAFHDRGVAGRRSVPFASPIFLLMPHGSFLGAQCCLDHNNDNHNDTTSGQRPIGSHSRL